MSGNRGRTMTIVCLVVAPIVFLLVFAMSHHWREGWKQSRCISNLIQLRLALQKYEDEHGSLPPAYITDDSGVPLHSWRVLLLPYLERDDLHRQIKLDEPWNSPHNRQFESQMPHIYKCPSDVAAKDGETSYAAVTGEKTLWSGTTGRELPNELDGPAILLVEVANLGISWMEPRDLPLEAALNVGTEPNSIGLLHPCGGEDDWVKGVYCGSRLYALFDRLFGTNCLFVSGSVCTLSETISRETMEALLTGNGRDVLRHPSGVEITTTERKD